MSLKAVLEFLMLILFLYSDEPVRRFRRNGIRRKGPAKPLNRNHIIFPQVGTAHVYNRSESKSNIIA